MNIGTERRVSRVSERHSVARAAFFRASQSIFMCFRLTPWTENVARSLLKEPKVYLWDWSGITDIGKRTENFLEVSGSAMKITNRVLAWRYLFTSH